MTDLTLVRMVLNIHTAYRNATLEQKLAGARWYAEAHALAAAVAEETGLTTRQVAGVIAVLSPGVFWSYQIKTTKDFVLAVLAGEDVTGEGFAYYNRNRAKAVRIINGEDPDRVVSGPKVTAFYRNILSKGTDDNVTIDRHALRVALGGDYTPNQISAFLKPYSDLAAQAYRLVAAALNLSPAELQAVCWVWWKSRTNRDQLTPGFNIAG